MSAEEWAAVDHELFALAARLRNMPPPDPEYAGLKNRFGQLFVRKFGTWLACHYGHSLWNHGIEVQEVLHDLYLVVHHRLFLRDGLRRLEFSQPEKLMNYLFLVARKTATAYLESSLPRPPRMHPGPAPETPGWRWIWKYLPFLDPEQRGTSSTNSPVPDFTPAEQKAMFLWHVDRCTHQEIAVHLSTTANAAKQLLYRAKHKLLTRMPLYAGEECAFVLRPLVVKWLEQYGSAVAGSSRDRLGPTSRVDAATLDTLAQALWLLRIGVREGKTFPHGSDTRQVIRQKLRLALKQPSADNGVTSAMEGLSTALIEILSCLVVDSARRAPRSWARGSDQDPAPSDLGTEQVESLTLLFFSLSALLPRRSGLPRPILGPARHVLSKVWMSPPVPSAEWYERVSLAMRELDRPFADCRNGGANSHSRIKGSRGSPADQVMPEVCLILGFIDVTGDAQKDHFLGGLPESFWGCMKEMGWERATQDL